MKHFQVFVFSVALSFVVSACGGEAATPTPTVAIDSIYTFAAQTLDAQNALILPTSTPPATPSPLPTSTITLASFPTATANSVSYVSVASGCDNSVYLADVTIPDYTVLSPGETFTKTWSFQNTGTCMWNEYYTIDYASGDSMAGGSTYINQIIEPWQSVEISVTLTAPDIAGEYTGYWRLSNADGTPFGETVFVLIVVTEDEATSTPTSTLEGTTATATTTPTATSTATATATDSSSYPNP